MVLSSPFPRFTVSTLAHNLAHFANLPSHLQSTRSSSHVSLSLTRVSVEANPRMHSERTQEYRAKDTQQRAAQDSGRRRLHEVPQRDQRDRDSVRLLLFPRSSLVPNPDRAGERLKQSSRTQMANARTRCKRTTRALSRGSLLHATLSLPESAPGSSPVS